MALHVTMRNVIELHQEKRVDNVTAMHGDFGVFDDSFRKGEPRGVAPGLRAIAPDRKGNLVHFAPFHQVREVEVEDIVAFDDIWIALLDDPDEFLEKRRFIAAVRGETCLEAMAVLDGDKHDGVPRTFGIREMGFPLGAGFNVDLHTAQFLEAHVSEEPRRGDGEELLRLVAENAVGGIPIAGLSSRGGTEILEGGIVSFVCRKCASDAITSLA